jgi:glycosyltransferase involved in cell wall biosynthesis
MSADGRVFFLDITRLVARAGSAPLTGIDRVERAYLREMARFGDRSYILTRTALGWLALQGRHGEQILTWIDGAEPLRRAPLWARLLAGSRRTPALESALRDIAVARLSRQSLGRWIRQVAPTDAVWLSVGHVNLDEATLGQVRIDGGATVVVMIHDTIPLDHPEWSGKGAPSRLAAALDACIQFSDLILCPSTFAADSVRRHRPARQPVLVAPLGITLATADNSLLPPGLNLTHPYFVALGTIEPRKNIDLLLRVWAELGANGTEGTCPHLHLIGQRGWNSTALFRTLNSAPFMGQTVFEHGALPDAAVMALLQGARGFLAPSRAEGFGIPVVEAACLGLPVLATDLAVTREILGDYPTYLPPDDIAAWLSAIRTFPHHKSLTPLDPARFDWTAHFNLVFSKIT